MKNIPDARRPLQINREAVRMVIFTHHFKIIGNLHIPPHGRITDYLNKTLEGFEKDSFLAVTQAECFSIPDNKLQYVTEFLSIHKNHIQIMFPYRQEKRL